LDFAFLPGDRADALVRAYPYALLVVNLYSGDMV
jgi:hypothetical protein